MTRSNPPIRVWRPVYEAYSRAARRHGLIVGDLMSVILAGAPREDPELAARIISVDYGIPPTEAREVVTEITRELAARIPPQPPRAYERRKPAKRRYARTRPPELKPGKKPREEGESREEA